MSMLEATVFGNLDPIISQTTVFYFDEVKEFYAFAYDAS